ncbi:DUF1349 domain-containing protein [Daejeonella sp.]|uniref:DUF1349 domain-containing protein n=1 Tax=Daejeonella sp. TaxID=2805397 RepID=UPI0039838195
MIFRFILLIFFLIPTFLTAQKKLSITFDDLPFACMCETQAEKNALTDKLIATFKKYDIPAVGFVNEQKLYTNGLVDPAKTALIQKWLDAGLELANHGYNHVNINDITLAQYKQEILKGELVTKDLSRKAKLPYRFFRHPYLSPGNTLADRQELDAFLKQNKYKISPNTITYQDYTFSDAYEVALRINDTLSARRIREAYIPYTLSQFAAAEKQSSDLFSRDVSQILMVHANMLNADAFGDVAKALQDGGYSFVTIDEALKDKAYSRADTTKGRAGITWLSRWASEMGKGSDRYARSPVPQLVLDLARQTTFNHEKASGGTLPGLPPFVVVDKVKEFKILSSDALIMTAGEKTDLHNPASGTAFFNNAPKFLFTPDNDFDFSAKVKPDFEGRYDGGAILIYSDRDNWAKILFQNTGDKLLLGNSVVKNKVTDDSYFNIPQNREVYLRVRKVGRVFTFLTSQDGKQWDVVRDFVYHKTDNMMIGFYSQSPIGTDCEVEYSEIKYTGKD